MCGNFFGLSKPEAIDEPLVIIAEPMCNGVYHPELSQPAIDMQRIEMMLEKSFELLLHATLLR